jgi:pimeloyl-ACP methyl ester carboxylesterase
MSPISAQITGIKHRFIQVNGIKMHIAEQGQGPLVVLTHGWPELWYSWRHVLPVLAAAGYHAVAPDMRGYGQTDAPPNIEDYTQLQLVGDVVGLVLAIGYEQAVIAGHDLGAMVAHNAAILRPDLFRAAILLSVPYGARTEGAVKPTEAMRRRAPAEEQFYQTYFQTPGVAEKEFDTDPKRTLRMLLYSLSGSIPKEHKWRYMFGVNEKALDGCVDPKQLPGLAEAGRSGLLHRRILADRVSRRVELVSRTGHFLARDAVSDRTQAAAADLVCRRNRRRRGGVCKALRRQPGKERSESLEKGPAAGRWALDRAGSVDRGESADAGLSG